MYVSDNLAISFEYDVPTQMLELPTLRHMNAAADAKSCILQFYVVENGMRLNMKALQM